MEITKPTIAICGRTTFIATACLFSAFATGKTAAQSARANQEQVRRSASIQEARELLFQGDEAYKAGRYAEAVIAYAGARENIPDAPVSAELRAAATERYAQASVEHARLLSKNGDVAAAKAAVDKVLLESVAPNNAGALAFRAQLDDPIRTNPALTADHAKNVDAVRRLLYTAEGAYNLGKFDEAIGLYRDVLRIDSTNTAARRGIETVITAKTHYHAAAYDQTRAELLNQVDAGWETPIPASDLELGLDGPLGGSLDRQEITVAAKLNRIIIPQIALDQASLDEALDFLRLRSAEVDVLEPDPNRRGVNITANLGPPTSEVASKIRGLRFDLRLTEVPLYQVLKYLTDITGTKFTTDSHSVVITPLGSTSDALVMRSYRVPADFITSLSNGAAAGGADDDPFAEAPAGGRLLTETLSAEEVLKLQGLSFPDGASASYNEATTTLRVNTTEANHSIISQIIETVAQTEPVMVVVKFTMIRTLQKNLEELGFDWLINPFPLNSQDTVFAGGGTVGNTPGRTGADFISPVGGVAIDGVPADPLQSASNVSTNGLRSGGQGIQTSGIDNLLTSQSGLQDQSAVAPSFASFTGLFSDGQVQMLMRGLNQKKGTDVMAQPSTVTRSGQASKIEIVKEFIYPTEYEPPELPNSVGSGSGSTPVTPATPTAFEMREIGIILEVLPVADAERRYVDVTLNPSITDFDGFVNYGSPINSTTDGLLGPTVTEVTRNAILMPIFSAQQTSTQVSVLDGSTIVIGGLLLDSTQNVEDKVPVFGDIPLIGRLFSSQSTERISTALIFLVKVELQDPTGRPYRDR